MTKREMCEKIVKGALSMTQECDVGFDNSVEEWANCLKWILDIDYDAAVLALTGKPVSTTDDEDEDEELFADEMENMDDLEIVVEKTMQYLDSKNYFAD